MKKLLKPFEKTPALLHKLSSLRSEALSLTPKERIEFSQLAVKEPRSAAAQFKRMKASTERVIKQRTKFKIKSLQEEEEILSIPNISVDLKADIPTLGWLAQLPQSQIEEILRGVNAPDLAGAWIGPEKTLTKLSKAIPEKKFELVVSYRENLKPSREGAAFKKIHSASIAALRKQESQKPSKPSKQSKTSKSSKGKRKKAA